MIFPFRSDTPHTVTPSRVENDQCRLLIHNTPRPRVHSITLYKLSIYYIYYYKILYIASISLFKNGGVPLSCLFTTDASLPHHRGVPAVGDRFFTPEDQHTKVMACTSAPRGHLQNSIASVAPVILRDCETQSSLEVVTWRRDPQALGRS